MRTAPGNEREIQALISLIDDPDEGIYSHVREKIMSIGKPVVPVLERAWEVDDHLGDLFRTRVEDLLHSIHLSNTQERLRQWVDGGGEDLLEGALIICQYRYPDLDEQRVKARLSAIRQDIWLELNDHLTAFEKVRVFNHILFQVHGFKGNKRNYHAPQNCYLNEVLDSRKGNPLSLAIIYQVLAEDLHLSLRGVNLPNHFVLAYLEEPGAQPAAENGILFYVNAFSQGDILGRHEIDEFLQKLNLPKQEHFYRPCTNMDMVRRQLNNLVHAYEKQQDPLRTAEVKELMAIVGPAAGA